MILQKNRVLSMFGYLYYIILSILSQKFDYGNLKCARVVKLQMKVILEFKQLEC